MLIEIHMLKNYPAVNLNRDETGAPKTCMFGGVQRGRISSQCLKHSWRTSDILKDAVGRDMIGIRTRKLPDILEESLKKHEISDDYIEVLKKTVTGFGTKEGKENSKELKTAQIITYSPEDIAEITALLLEKLKTCKNVKDVEKIKAKELQDIMKKSVNRAVTLDMALFGRMVTSDAFADVEASMQVAHAISTNRVYMESDYFTAVDDLINGSETETGSAMIGDIDYNSSCYYIYASLDTDKLRDNLKYCDNADEVMKTAIPALLETMVYTNPSGKQNSFAGHSLPSAILVECKEKHIPVSYANAYEMPVKPFKDSGIVTQSVERLRDECLKISDCYGIPVEKRLWFTTKPEISFENDSAVNCVNFMELIEQLPKM
ncbi:MAG: type I-E CRISPR-associated protein Cas7/Cse4/CasC [Eubacteriales bacterium]